MSAAQALHQMQKMKTAAAAAELWSSDAVSTYDRHVIVKQLCFTKHASHVGIASAIIARVLAQPDTVRLSCPWVLLLCVTVARTHDPVYLEQIVRLKSSWTDLSMAVDSTLLFEFSPRGERATAVEDTIEWVKGEAEHEFPYKGETGEAIRAMVLRYVSQYGSEAVVRAWDGYRDAAAFSKRFDLSNEWELSSATLSGY
mmetsp:Transcript_33784/g.112753  ORF Transcript_33784/g.112753 Transcript_33784/m.112753 type:complete len:199 (+) Transcript_33784:280-876(+)|eukprot:CAMPEP_0185522590 /NCGR_PEP_ID=MMETSP1366-20130426/83140_1 /TAXON_ID=38817 /ORGANISM="Gephyrocapsa oceanica, Strain RCC1303" /LENGTH=198 /DNA_ID=CAMNT_0028133835 /DNA_START=246 /DNA_END=842 /DNA_ORIENTATION=-